MDDIKAAVRKRIQEDEDALQSRFTTVSSAPPDTPGLTLDKVLAAKKLLDEAHIARAPVIRGAIGSLFGMQVTIDPALDQMPKLKLSHRVKVSDRFREEFDQWLLDRFGVESRVYLANNQCALFMGGDMARKLQRHCGSYF